MANIKNIVYGLFGFVVLLVVVVSLLTIRSCKEGKTLKSIAKEQKTIDSLQKVVQTKNEQIKASEQRERSLKPLIDSLIQKSKNVQLKINQNEKQIVNDTARIRYFSDDELADFFTEYLRKKDS